MTQVINLEQAIDLIANSKGQFFTVEFIKRTTGELRTMQCKLFIENYLKGGEAAYNAREKNLIHVADIKTHGYRSINLDGLRKLKIHGEEYEVNHG